MLRPLAGKADDLGQRGPTLSPHLHLRPEKGGQQEFHSPVRRGGQGGFHRVHWVHWLWSSLKARSAGSRKWHSLLFT